MSVKKKLDEKTALIDDLIANQKQTQLKIACAIAERCKKQADYWFGCYIQTREELVRERLAKRQA